VTCKTDP